jgi:inosine/xanthosine triphosphate pyrophosphatase family protein
LPADSGKTSFLKRSRFAWLRFGLREKECGETMKLLYATGNEAKIRNMRYRLDGYDIGIVTPKELGISIDVEETGTTPTENARLKAKAYFEKTGMPTLAADSGLYIDGIPDEEQPGLYVRRVNGRTLSEEELIRHYSLLSEKYGGKLRARYKTGLVLLIEEDEYTTVIPDDDIFIVSEPNQNREHGGNPLDVVTVCPANGKYFNDCSLAELAELAGHFDKECVRFLRESVLK